MADVLDKTKCKLKTCTFNDICHIFEDFHYKKSHMGGGISTCFAMFIDDVLVGGSVLGKPRHEHKYKNCSDIRRMACVDSAPKNSESWFLSQIIKWIACNTDYEGVLSYSDTTVGPQGTIYKGFAAGIYCRAFSGVEYDCRWTCLVFAGIDDLQSVLCALASGCEIGFTETHWRAR